MGQHAQQTNRCSLSGAIGWTTRRLRAAGFDAGLADELAGDTRIDLHELLGLVDRGCPPGLALRIVWPLDEESRQW